MTSMKICACLASFLALVFLTGCPKPVSLTPNALSFAPQLVDPTGTTSAPQSVLLRAGSSSFGVGTITVTGPYSQTNDCPATLAASASCTIEVTFAPNAVGGINGELRIGTSSLRTEFTGTGLAPVGFSPANLDFGTVAVGSTGTAQIITLTNNQATPLTVSGISASGNYSQSNNCPTPLPAGASCTLNVNFQPTVKGTVAGAITVITDATLAAQPVGLTGVGSGTATSGVSFTPASLDFGAQEAGTSSPSQTVTLKNSNPSASLTITSVVASAGYVTTDTCAGKLLSGGGTCIISATFKPTTNVVSIPYPGAITVVDGGSTSPHVIALSGSGVAPLSSAPNSLDFGAVVFNTTSAPQTLTLTNQHSASETSQVAATGPFGLASNSCNVTLAPGTKCTLDVNLGPGSVGPVTGAVTATFSSGGFLNPHVVSVSGCRTEVVRTPQSLNFGAVTVGKTSEFETVTISGGIFNFSGLSFTGANAAEFAIGNNTCGNAINSGSCSLDLSFTPAATGVRKASLQIADDQHCSPQPVSLTGGSSAGPFVLTGILNGTGSGNLTSSPTGLNCGSQGTSCSASFVTGKAVTVTATPDANSSFAGWSGACSGATPCNLAMDADRQIVATFNLNPLLTVSLGGNASGQGRVTSSPPGIDCQNPAQPTSTCQSYFAPGTSVQLMAVAGAGSIFAGWNTACSGTGTCSVTMNADQSVGATFNGPPTVNISLAGAGTGTVTSTPPGINCPAAQCSSTFPSATAVTLTATAGNGFGFDGWTGPCTGTTPCTFNVTTDQTVVAAFDPPDFAVSVTPPNGPSIPPGGHTSFNVALGAQGGFANPVTLNCSAPTTQGVNCALSSTSVKPGGSVTLTVTTQGPSATLTPLPMTRPSRPAFAVWISLPALAFVGMGFGALRSKKRQVLMLLVCSALLGFLGLQIACSSGGSSIKNPGTPAGTYTVSVSAISGTSLQHSSSVTVTVQ